MPSSKKVNITMETPAEIGKLSKEETERLKNIFRTAIANVLSGKLPEGLLSLVINNTSSTPSGGAALSSKSAKSASKKGSKKAGRESAK